MDSNPFRRGQEIRSEVLGAEYVQRATARMDDFNGPLQEMIATYCWGEVWGREGLSRKSRSMINLAMLSALNRPHEMKTHVGAALRNGVTREEIREILLQVTVYCGIPAGVDAFRIAGEVLAEAEKNEAASTPASRT